jgi:biotin carboxyl carrier protein
MIYRVTIGEKSFDVDVQDGPTGTLVGGEPVSLVFRHGPLGTLVREGSALDVSCERGATRGAGSGGPETRDDVVFEVQLPGGRAIACSVEDERARLARRSQGGAGAERRGPRTVRAVMPGIVVKIAVEIGAIVQAGDALLVVEAMKMQNEIRAEAAGVASKVHVKAGQSVAAGALLVEITPAG